MPSRTAYSEDFLDFVEGKTFHNPDTGNKVVFDSLPDAEKTKIHTRWEQSKPDAPEGAKLRKNQHGEQYVDDSPYAERMSEYLSAPSKRAPRETKIWESIRDWAVGEKPSDHEFESLMMAIDSGHFRPPESTDEVDDVAQRLGIGKHRRTSAMLDRVALVRRRVHEVTNLRHKLARHWRSLSPTQRSTVRAALADEG